MTSAHDRKKSEAGIPWEEEEEEEVKVVVVVVEEAEEEEEEGERVAFGWGGGEKRGKRYKWRRAKGMMV